MPRGGALLGVAAVVVAFGSSATASAPRHVRAMQPLPGVHLRAYARSHAAKPAVPRTVHAKAPMHRGLAPLPFSRSVQWSPHLLGLRATSSTITVTQAPMGAIFESLNYGGRSAEFTDSAHPTPIADGYGATLNFGDGKVYSTAGATASISCPGTGGAGTCDVSIDGHSYADEGAYSVTVTVYAAGDTPTGPSAATGTGTLTAGESDTLVGRTPTPLHLTTTNSFSGSVATFTNSGYSSNSASDFTASINWGDAATTSGTVSSNGSGRFSVSGSHTYAAGGSYSVSVTLTDDSPGTATATVNTKAGTISYTGITSGAIVEKSTYSGSVAVFTDGANSSPSASGYGATFDLGDGTVASTTGGTASITCPGTGGAGSCDLKVPNGHSYADEGVYTVTATIYPAGDSPTGSTAFTDTGTLTAGETDVLAAAAPVAINTVQNVLFSGTVETFTNSGYPSNSASDFTASINWGNATTTTGTVAADGLGAISVSGSHTYLSTGNHPVAVTLSDDSPGTATATANTTATTTPSGGLKLWLAAQPAGALVDVQAALYAGGVLAGSATLTGFAAAGAGPAGSAVASLTLPLGAPVLPGRKLKLVLTARNACASPTSLANISLYFNTSAANSRLVATAFSYYLAGLTGDKGVLSPSFTGIKLQTDSASSGGKCGPFRALGTFTGT